MHAPVQATVLTTNVLTQNRADHAVLLLQNSSFSGILALLVGVGIVIHQVRKKRRNKKLRQQLQRESSAAVQRSAPVSRPPLVAYSTGTVSQYMYPYPFGGQTSAAPALQMGVFHGAQGKQPFDSNALSYFDAVGDEAEEACAICLGPLGDEKVAAAPCGHVQHGSCLSSWFSKDLSCPRTLTSTALNGCFLQMRMLRVSLRFRATKRVLYANALL